MAKSKLRKTFRFAGLIFGIAAAIVVLVALAILFRIHIANEWQQYVRLPIMTPQSHSDSVVVFAPHSDDETLGCGGMLATAVQNGAKVRVVGGLLQRLQRVVFGLAPAGAG